jgi:PhnB protein
MPMPNTRYAPPKGYHAVTPYLRVKGAEKALAFYKAAFGAKERNRLMMPDGRVGHAELELGDSRIMLSDEFPEMGIKGPASLNGTTFALSLYVANADQVFDGAVKAGAKVLRPLEDMFYGDRSGQLEDPFGHIWSVQQRLEDVTPREMQKRLDKTMSQGGSMAEAKAKPKASKRAAPGKSWK